MAKKYSQLIMKIINTDLFIYMQSTVASASKFGGSVMNDKMKNNAKFPINAFNINSTCLNAAIHQIDTRGSH